MIMISTLLNLWRRQRERKLEKKRRKAFRRFLIGACLFGAGVFVGRNYPAIRDCVAGKAKAALASRFSLPFFNK